jgi:hypothetical protein
VPLVLVFGGGWLSAKHAFAVDPKVWRRGAKCFGVSVEIDFAGSRLTAAIGVSDARRWRFKPGRGICFTINNE